MPISKSGAYYNVVPTEGTVNFTYKATSKDGSCVLKGEAYNSIHCYDRESAEKVIAEWNAESTDFDFSLI